MGTRERVCDMKHEQLNHVSLDKYKPALLAGDVARALVSVIALLPQQDNSKQRKEDLSYYLSRSVDGKDDMEKYVSMNPSAVSHICCALANFATNRK